MAFNVIAVLLMELEHLRGELGTRPVFLSGLVRLPRFGYPSADAFQLIALVP